MYRTEKERKQEASKPTSPLLPFHTGAAGPAPVLQPLRGGAGRTSTTHPAPHFPVSAAAHAPSFLIVFTSTKAEYNSVYWVYSQYNLFHHQQKGVDPARALSSAWCGRQGECGNRNNWLNVKVWKWRRRKSACYILNSLSVPLQDGKSEPLPSVYLPGANSTQDNFQELFLWLCSNGRISEL